MKKSLLTSLVQLAYEVSTNMSTLKAPAMTPPDVEGATRPPVRQAPMPGSLRHEPADESVLSPFAPAEQAVLRTPIDAVNCGEYSFSLYNIQLIISMLGTGGGVGGEYDVSRLTLREWTALLGRDGTPLPIQVLRNHGAVTVQVGNDGLPSQRVASPTR